MADDFIYGTEKISVSVKNFSLSSLFFSSAGSTQAKRRELTEIKESSWLVELIQRFSKNVEKKSTIKVEKIYVTAVDSSANFHFLMNSKP